jgi:uncharacterized protein (DUF433 family)
MSLAVEPEPIPLTFDRDGVVRVTGTRVTLDTIIAAFQEGTTSEEFAQQYPSLPLADVYAVIGYYLRHQPEVDDYLRQRQQFAVEARRGNEVRFDPAGVRDRLLARRAK